MGGRGSGRRATYCGKNTTEDSLPLDIRRLQRDGMLSQGHVCSWQWLVNGQQRASIFIQAYAWSVELTFSYTGSGAPPEAIRQTVLIEKTPCTLGGYRHWFSCPACSKRVAVLYGRGRLFACRQCKGLAYASQGETSDDRAFRRVERIRKRLGWPPGIINSGVAKPKRMHWRTYWRLRFEHDRLALVALEGPARRLGFLSSLYGEEPQDDERAS